MSKCFFFLSKLHHSPLTLPKLLTFTSLPSTGPKMDLTTTHGICPKAAGLLFKIRGGLAVSSEQGLQSQHHRSPLEEHCILASTSSLSSSHPHHGFIWELSFCSAVWCLVLPIALLLPQPSLSLLCAGFVIPGHLQAVRTALCYFPNQDSGPKAFTR